MLNEIYILDDVIPLEYQDYIEQSILGSDLNWLYRPNLGNNTPKENINDYNPAPGIIHVFCNEQGIQSKLFHKITPVIQEACRKINYELTGVFGGRTFVQFPGGNNREFTKIHTDLDVDHIVLLYYVIDADGDTVIFDKTTFDIPKDKLDPSKLTVLQRITPKKGRIAIFDGSRYHATTLPVMGKRCIINVNLK